MIRRAVIQGPANVAMRLTGRGVGAGTLSVNVADAVTVGDPYSSNIGRPLRDRLRPSLGLQDALPIILTSAGVEALVQRPELSTGVVVMVVMLGYAFLRK